MQLHVDAGDLVIECLSAVRTRADLHAAVDARCALGVHRDMAAFDGRHDDIPFTLNIGAVGMQHRLEACGFENALAGRDIRRDRYPDPDGDEAEFNIDVHDQTPQATVGVSLQAAMLSLKSLIAYLLRIMSLRTWSQPYCPETLFWSCQ